ncbi:hypothetical protein RYX56_14410 [Alkalihalophilus lindianensis]|uniref:Uncharacterized protein n=1 Tax=Alkalihalophilus lindianensis TaxID=1630542 RepID=A0ABU3XCE3_9BACI|nr:hypothetical protein [Alkalihalophilus lindianensis]MDV2685556.1 hypothetical protein [Alkalihalophilus lindianensis]
MLKKILLLALSSLAIPIGIAILGGGGFIILNLILGVSLEESLQAIQGFQQKIQPYMPYMVIFIAIPLIVKLIRQRTVE